MALASIILWPFCLLALTLTTPTWRWSSADSNPFNERLQAQGLIGSHFGTVDQSTSFDYIIIGGGTAGLTVARRLAENNAVAVIEAGSLYELDNANLTEIPADASYYLGKEPLMKNPLIDWLQETTPQLGLEGQPALYPQGKTLGGGSTRNFMWYQRGSTGSYQKWAEEVGDDSYEFPSFRQYFEKSVHFTPPNKVLREQNAIPLYDATRFSPTDGPLQVSWPNFASPAATWIARGLSAVGLRQLPGGMADGNLFGWSWIAQTIDPLTQVRSSSESSFLCEALKLNDNLVVFRSTIAKKILFDEGKTATGIEIETGAIGSGSVVYTLNATKEIVLSAGAFRSPQLLMVSGIGPATTLQDNGICVIADRPGVGQNMWDHVWFGPAYAFQTVTHGSLANPAFAAQAALEYTTNRTGILTNVGGDILGFEKLPNGTISPSTRTSLDQTFGSDWPDIEIFSLDAYTGTLSDYLLGAPDAGNYSAVSIALVAPFSRGNVSIASADTNIHPVVNPALLTDPRDQEVAVAGFKRARAVLQSDAVKPGLIGGEVYPGPQVLTDADILDTIRKSADSIHHAAGTCKMGKVDDVLAVVDSQTRVIGVQGLRVVDASAFPILPPGHPQSSVYALAEKIADLMLHGNTNGTVLRAS